MDEENTQATQPNDGSFLQNKPRPWGHLASLVHTYPHMDLFHTEYYFGRKKECALYFKDPRISAEHCRIYRSNIAPQPTDAPCDSDNTKITNDNRTVTALKQFEPPHLDNDFSVYIEDLSSNGTFVNGTRVGKGNRHLLKHKDEISLVGRYGSTNCVAAYVYQDAAVRELENDPAEDVVSQKYQMGSLLGTGNFSSVRLGISRQTGQKFAIKVIDKMKYYNSKAIDQIAREVDILKQIKHPNIITIYDCYATKRYIYLVLELASGGELFEKIMHIGNYNEDEARKVFIQMLEAVDYLHDRGIAHRDLKPENILLQSKDSNLIKISDFGLAKLVGEREMMTTLCGTPQYAAPEIISQSLAQQVNKNQGSSTFAGYGKEVDMWSLGAILYVLLSGTLPFDEERSLTPLFIQIQKGELEFPPEFWMEISEEAKDLIRKLMTVDPKLRLDVKQALQHPWITQSSNSSQSKQLKVSTNLRKNKSHLMGAMSPIKGRPLSASGNSDTEDEATKLESRSPKPEADNNTLFIENSPKPVQKNSSSKNNHNNTTSSTEKANGKRKPESIIIVDNSPKKGKENLANFVDLTEESPLVVKTRPKRKSTGSQDDNKNTKKKLNFST